MLRRRCAERGALVLLLAAGLWGAGCGNPESDDSPPPKATEVEIADRDAVEAEHVEQALQALWPLIAVRTEVDAELQALSAQVETLTEAVTALQASQSVTPIGGEPTALQELVVEQQATIEAHEASIRALEGELATAESDLSAAQAALETVQSELAALKSDFDTFTSTTTEQLVALDSAIGSPRPCPNGMIAIDSQSCIESEARGPHTYAPSMAICQQYGMRLCTVQEVFNACQLMEAELAPTAIKDTPHWVMDGASRLKHSSGYWDLSGIAIGGVICESAWEASSISLGEDVDNNLFHFRCCIDRM